MDYESDMCADRYVPCPLLPSSLPHDGEPNRRHLFSQVFNPTALVFHSKAVGSPECLARLCEAVVLTEFHHHLTFAVVRILAAASLRLEKWRPEGWGLSMLMGANFG